MRPRKTKHEREAINAFKQYKILTIITLCTLLQFSVATVRRRLKEWGALSSYNKSGRYYTLPLIPKFNKKGLWRCQEAFFSKHGTLKNTVIHLVQISSRGLSNSELEEILGINPNSYLPQCKQLEGVKREKHNRQVIYFSVDENLYKQQKRNRFPPEPATLKLPPDAISIIVLVKLIKFSNSTPAELADMLKHEGYEIDTVIIENLLKHHGLIKKNRI